MSLSSGTSLGSFEILGILGVGGMGEVYRARDSKLGREVAIKVLPEAFAQDRDRLVRFEREARTLASLDHPNVASIYDFQEDSGNHFLVMQLIAGSTLADRLSRGVMPIREALTIFVDIADGLASAHESGIIHRDLKPANLKIDLSGRVKILDFGLAKAFEPGESDSGAGNTLALGSDSHGKTTEGQILGTPAYMSPEQARGQAVDKRTDIWAYGVCLYEALAGKRPFVGETATDLLADILRGEPDWTALPADLPSHVKSLLRRCLEKPARRRFSSIGDIAITLEDTVSDWGRGFSSPTPTPAPAPTAPQWGYDTPTPSAQSPSTPIPPTPFTSTPAPPHAPITPTPTPTPTADIAKRINRIAVLPFDNLMGDEAQEHFVFGMSEALSTELSKMTGVEVVSHNSAMHYKGTNKLPKQIAMELGVDGLLGGAIMRAGEDIRITVRLIDGKTDRQIWADQYNGKHAQILSLQGQVALAVAEQISSDLTTEDRLKTINAPEVNPEAHEAYLLGRHLAARRYIESMKLAQEQFEKSIAIDPNYAPAYGGLADLLINFGILGGMRPSRAFAQAREYAQKAIQLDSASAAALAVLGAATMYQMQDWVEAEHLLHRAVAQNSEEPIAHIHLGLVQMLLGRSDEAIQSLKIASTIDPLSHNVWTNLASAHNMAGRFELAFEYIDRAIRIDSKQLGAHLMKIWALLGLDRIQEALAVADDVVLSFPGDKGALQTVALAYARGGREQEAREIAEETPHAGASKAWIYLLLGEPETALDQLEASLTEVEFWALACGYGPMWDPIRTYPRFRAVRRKLGFTKDDDIDPSELPTASKDIDRIAVLPFDNLMGDEAQEHFVYGMTEALSTELSKMTGVEVVSHNSAMHYKGTNKLPKQIAMELGVDGLLAGAIMRAGEDIRITVRLIDGKTDRQIWADQYNGKHAQILSLQGQVALAVAEQISSELTPEDRLKTINAPEVNPEAHEACMVGGYFRLRASTENFVLSEENFGRSIAIAPDYAPGYSGLANLKLAMATYGMSPSREGYSEARAYARKAIELDPALGEAYAVLGFTSMPLDRDWAESERLFDRAIELAPDDALTHTFRGTLFAFTGRHEDAERACAAACRLDPLTNLHWDVRGLAAFYRRDPETALMHLDRAAALTPDPLSGLQTRIQILVHLRRFDAAAAAGDRLLAAHGATPAARYYAAYAFAQADRMDEAREIFDPLERKRAEELGGTAVPGLLHLALGDHERAIDNLEASLGDADIWTTVCGYCPIWDPVRSHPRFRAVRRKAGFDKDDDIDPSELPVPAKDIDRIVVLPFENLMGDEAQEYFVDGMTEALSTELSKMSGVDVIAHDSAMHYKGTEKPLKQIALELGVDALLRGAIMRGGDDIRITVRLIDPKTDRQIWADHYEGKHAQILSLQGQAALAVAEQISSELTTEDRLKTVNAPEVNPEAYEAYLLGRHFGNRRSYEELRKSVEYFERAIELAPDYAPAHAGLGETYMIIGIFTFLPQSEAFRLTRECALEAKRLDPRSGHAHVLLAFAMAFGERDWPEIERLCARAVELAPEEPWTRRSVAHISLFNGRFEFAAANAEAACRLDPLMPINWAIRALVHFAARDYDKALSYVDRAYAFDSGFPNALIFEIWIHISSDRAEEAVAAADKIVAQHSENVAALACAAQAYAFVGRNAEARAMLEKMEDPSRSGSAPEAWRMLILLYLGDQLGTLDALESTVAEAVLISLYSGYMPIWDPVRRDPRFRAIRKKLGFTKDDDLDLMPAPEAAAGREASADPVATSVPAKKIEKIAVLPFENLMGDPEQEYFVDGMTDALSAELGKIRSLKVISRTSAMRYKGTDKSIPEIARELGVDALVEGSILRAGNEVRITAQLVHGWTDQHLWANTFDGTLDKILSLQGAVALEIAEQVHATVAPEEKQNIAKKRTVHPEAYDAYLRGKFHHFELTPEGLRRSQELFEKAAELDPEFAPAYAYIAISYWAPIWWFAPPAPFEAKIREAAQTAVRLDDSDAMAHTSAGWVALTLDRDWPRAEEEFRRGIELNPGLAEPYAALAMYFNSLGRFDEAIEAGQNAVDRDPLNAAMHGFLASHYAAAGRSAEALRERCELLDLDPRHWLGRIELAEALLADGQPQAALESLSKTAEIGGRQPLVLSVLARIYRSLGRQADAKSVLAELLAKSENEYVQSHVIAYTYAAAGQMDKAFECLERALEERQFLLLNPHVTVFDKFRGDPRFNSILDRMNHPGTRPAGPEKPSSAPTKKIEKIAVLPFENLMGDPEQDYFVDGMTDSLVSHLVRVGGLQVVSRNSSKKFKNSDQPIPLIARELGADAIVEGSVMKAGNNVRINARLVHGWTDEHVWADQFDGELEDIFDLQTRLAIALAEEGIGSKAVSETDSQAGRARSSRSISPEAHDALLRGRFFFRKRNPAAFRIALESFKKAVELEPDYAEARAELADCYVISTAFGFMRGREAFELAEPEARRAVELDPDSPMAQIALGTLLLFRDIELGESEKVLRKALELDPTSPVPYFRLQNWAVRRGDHEQAHSLLDEAIRLDPLDPIYRSFKAQNYILQCEYELARREVDAAFELEPGYFYAMRTLFEIHFATGAYDSAFKLAESLPPGENSGYVSEAYRARALAALGRSDQARQLIEEIDRAEPNETVPYTDVARACQVLGDYDGAFDWLGRACANLDIWRTLAARDPFFEPSHSDPRWRDFLAAIGRAELDEFSQPSTGPENPPAKKIQKIAVLPFTSIARDDSEDWFVDGMTEALITELGKIKSLIVISRTSAMRYKGTDKPLTEIAAELKVDALVEGSVIRMGDDLQITARLIDGNSDERVWGDFFAGKLENVLKLQGEVRLAIAREVEATVTPEEKAAIENAPQVKSAAYEEYLRARTYHSEASETGLLRATDAYEKAIELDPHFASAHAGLAVTCADRISYIYSQNTEVRDRMMAAAERALELESSCAEAHVGMGLALRHTSFDWQASERHFLRAIELEPNSWQGHLAYASLLSYLGRHEQAVAEGQIAVSLDPLSSFVRSIYAVVLYFAGDHESCFQLCIAILKDDETSVMPRICLIRLHLVRGEIEEAGSALAPFSALAQSGAVPIFSAIFALQRSMSGDLEGAGVYLEKLLNEWREDRGSAGVISWVYAFLGDKDSAIEWLGRAIDSHESPVWLFVHESHWDSVRDDPRFRALVKRLGLPD